MKRNTIISRALKKLGLVDYYPDAGENAQPEVQSAIRRFKQEGHTDDNLFYWLLGEGTHDFKMPKTLATYSNESEFKEKRCNGCEFSFQKVYNKHYHCSMIEGEIKLTGWCRLWKKGEKE